MSKQRNRPRHALPRRAPKVAAALVALVAMLGCVGAAVRLRAGAAADAANGPTLAVPINAADGPSLASASSVSTSASPSPTAPPPSATAASTAPTTAAKSTAKSKTSTKATASSTPSASASASGSVSATTSASASAVSFAQQVLALTNAQRTANGCPALTWNATLATVAQAHSQDMATRNFFDHTNPDGVTAAQRVTAAGYAYTLTAENIAAGQANPADVMTSWMGSAGHRANILNCALTELGVGYATGGSYGSYWTEDFGTR